MGEPAPRHVPAVCAKPAFWHLMLVPTLSISLPASIVGEVSHMRGFVRLLF